MEFVESDNVTMIDYLPVMLLINTKPPITTGKLHNTMPK